METRPAKTGKIIALALLGIFILALGLRLWGIGFGLPYEYHVDENQYVRQAATMGSGGLKPTEWQNPPFFKYLLLGEYGGLFVLGRFLGWFASAADFGARFRTDPTWLYLLGRATSALMGALTVLVTFWLSKKAYSLTTGLISAFLFAIAFLPVRESHFAVNDAAATLWIALALLASIGILRSGKWRWYITGGIVLGLGFATKYHTIITILPLVIAHFYSPGVSSRKLMLPKLIALPGIALVTTILVSPYFILDAKNVLYYVTSLSREGQVGFEGWALDSAGGYIFYLKTLFWGLGWTLAALCLAGVIAAFIRHQPVDIILLTVPVTMYIFLGGQKMYFGRFLLPMVPPLVVLASILMVDAIHKIFRTQRSQKIALICISLIVAVQPFIDAVRLDYLLTQTDTRTLAKEWIEAHIPAGARIALDWQFHCPPLATDDKAVAASNRTYQVWYSNYPAGKGLPDHNLDWFRENGYEYLVACSHLYRIPVVNSDQNKSRAAFYASLNENLPIVKQFKPYEGVQEPPFIFDEIYGPAISLWQRERPGPTIVIYKLDR